MTTNKQQLPLTTNHWGTYRVETRDGRVVGMHDFEEDPHPSPIGRGIVDVLDGPNRIKAPMVRQHWLEGNYSEGTEKRGIDAFVEVSWDEAERLVAQELDRVRTVHGNEAIFAGSYGWASAGRFHHAQGQLRRFLNCIGGATRAVDTYSLAAAEVILPHIVGSLGCIYGATSWDAIIGNTTLFVAFGGLPLKNGQIAQGGVGRHRQHEAMIDARAAGVEFVNISPLRSDATTAIEAKWLAPRPSTDTALMLALTHTLIVEELTDDAFLAQFCVGFEPFSAYLTGETDGVEKSAAWAAEICELPAETIRELARRMAANRTMISLSWSLTRHHHGEHTIWAGVALACALGQIGLPGGGIGFGYSATNTVGLERTPIRYQALPQGHNPVDTFIPVARISDLLLNPGQPFDYNGRQYRYPDTKLVYWAGGNPFHHHQDLNRMRLAWQKPETIVVHEWCWNAVAKHADIVLPCTTTLEREDIAISPRDTHVVHMAKAIEPTGDARNDFDILRGIARNLGVEDAYTEGRAASEWLEWLYEASRESAAAVGRELPPLDALKADGWCSVAGPSEPYVVFADFRRDPVRHPLKTPSGKFEIYSEIIAQFGYDDCPPHPTWMEPFEWLGGDDPAYPLHLISNQPSTKLHSHLDHGSESRAGKLHGREPVTMHPDDAAARNIAPGDIVRLFNGRGACLGAVVTSNAIRPGVVQMSTGAWLDLDEVTGVCKHGNPNVLTRDIGTSRLAQGPTAHTCLVEIERYDGVPPTVTAHTPPTIIRSENVR